MIKSVLLGSGKIMLGAAKVHCNDKNSLIIAGALGLGAAVADKKVGTGILIGSMAMAGMIGLTSLNVVDRLDELANDNTEEE